MVNQILNNLKTPVVDSRTKLIPISFTLDQSYTTSCGIYDSNDMLIRTLWSNKKYLKGNHTVYWNKEDDDKRLVPNGNYTPKILKNNVNWVWEGVGGNTSKTQSGPLVHKSLRGMRGITFVGNQGFLTTGYNEQAPAYCKIDLTNPNQRVETTLKTGALEFYDVVNDGSYVYFAGASPDITSGAYYSIIVRTNILGEAFQPFSAGTSHTAKYSGIVLTGVAGRVAGSGWSGISVQRTGNLMIAKNDLGRATIFNKNTGATIIQLANTGISKVCFDTNNFLWLSTSTITTKYSITDDGVITTTGITFNHLSIQASRCSTDGNYILIADGGSSQQLKSFSTVDGSLISTFGDINGYQKDSRVNNHKFYFNDTIRNTFASNITFTDAGTFWVLDQGNNRYLHYNANFEYLDQIMYRLGSYCCRANKGDPTKVYSDYLQYTVDYSKPISDPTSWVLTHNWTGQLAAQYLNSYRGLLSVNTFPNGRVYSFVSDGTKSNNSTLIELIESTGAIRFTGVDNQSQGAQLYGDGSYRLVNNTNTIGGLLTYYRKDFVGTDVNNNPIWGGFNLICTVTRKSQEDPIWKSDVNHLNPCEITDSGKLITFNQQKEVGYHLGAIKVGDDKLCWKTCWSTLVPYEGPYPNDGYFDIGNNVRNAASKVHVEGNNLVWNYYGEFWQSSQTNMWHHYYENGLMVGIFGITGPNANATGANPAKMAGNAFGANMVKVNGKLWVYHCDESYHGGFHRWRCDNAESISLDTLQPINIQNVNGLWARYLSGVDVNTCLLKKSIKVNNINFNNFSILNIDNTLEEDNYSVVFDGYIIPILAVAHTFYINTFNGRFKLTIDGVSIISNITTTATGEFTGTYSFNDLKPRKVRIEYANQNDSTNFTLQWSSATLSKSIIPTENFYYVKPNNENIFRLNESFNTSSTVILVNNLYGFTRFPIDEDYTDQYNKFWSVKSGIKVYNKYEESDLTVQQRGKNFCYVNKYLGDNKNLNNWKFTCSIDMLGTQRSDLNNNFAISILDNNQKIICYVSVLHAPDVNGLAQAKFVFNNIIMDSRNENELIYGTVADFKPLEFIYKNNKLYCYYGNLGLFESPISDNTANIKNPCNFRITCNTATVGLSQGKKAAIKNAYFIK